MGDVVIVGASLFQFPAPRPKEKNAECGGLTLLLQASVDRGGSGCGFVVRRQERVMPGSLDVTPKHRSPLPAFDCLPISQERLEDTRAAGLIFLVAPCRR